MTMEQQSTQRTILSQLNNNNLPNQYQTTEYNALFHIATEERLSDFEEYKTLTAKEISPTEYYKLISFIPNLGQLKQEYKIKYSISLDPPEHQPIPNDSSFNETVNRLYTFCE